MKNTIIEIVQDIKSDQTDKDGNPIISLKKGDVVELKNEAIYLTRKLEPWALEGEKRDLAFIQDAFEKISFANEKT